MPINLTVKLWAALFSAALPMLLPFSLIQKMNAVLFAVPLVLTIKIGQFP